MNEACNKSEEKVLDEFMKRIEGCASSVGARASLISEICNELQGPCAHGACGDAKDSEPCSIFDKLDRTISYAESSVKALESGTDRLRRII